MRFLVDANLPRSAAQVVAGAGHQAVDVRDVGLAAAEDWRIAQYAQLQGLCIVTRDFDFADIRNYPPADYVGLVVLDLPDSAVSSQINDLLALFLRRSNLDQIMPGRLAIVRLDRVRFRPRLAP